MVANFLFKQNSHNKFCAVASNILVSPVWKLLLETILRSSILRWFQKFWKICTTLSLRNGKFVPPYLFVMENLCHLISS